MKRAIAVLIAVVFALSFVGCSGSNNVLNPAWKGDFNETELRSAIDEYEKNYSPIKISSKEEAKNFEINIGSGADKCSSLGRISPVGDEYDELSSYIDLAVNSSYDKETGVLSADLSWWYDESGRMSDANVWSYLCCTESGGEKTYLYFRVCYED